MFSLLRNRFGAPGIIAVVALVFAMVGGAYAAKKYVITSTSQIKPSVLKALKGAAGAPGATGAAGAKGDAGANGSNGTNGTNGVSVTSQPATVGECPAGGTKFTSASGTGKACNGEDGAQGDPWVPNNTLPPGATLTGAWTFGKTTGAQQVYVPISFPIPLAAALDENHVHFIEKNGKETIFDGVTPFVEKVPTDCLGTPAAPSAKPGHLCIYTRDLAQTSQVISNILNIEKVGAESQIGASTAGARVFFEVNNANGQGVGSWAVTAPN